MKLQCKEFVYTMENIMARTSVKTKLGDISNLVKFVYYGGNFSFSFIRKKVIANYINVFEMFGKYVLFNFCAASVG